MTSTRTFLGMALASLVLGACSGSGGKSVPDGGGGAGGPTIGDPLDPGGAAGNRDAAAALDAADAPRADRAGADTDPSALSAFADEVTAITCRKAFECCTAAELAALVGKPVTTPEMCQAAYSAVDIDVVEALIAAGQLAFHPEHVAACLAASRTARCSQIFDIEPIKECLPVLSGSKQIGEKCSRSRECATNRCAGTCLAADACDGQFVLCPADASCNLATGRCLPLKDQGAACDPMAPVGGSCKPNLYCSAATSMCTPRGAAGAPCGFDLVDDGSCAPDGGNNRCGGDSACADGLFCNAFRAGTCVARPADGAACTRLHSCRDGLYCPIGGGTCKPLLPDGAPCTGPGQCKSSCVFDPGKGATFCSSASGTAQCSGRPN